MTPEEIRVIAKRNRWDEIPSKDPTMVSFGKTIRRNPARINVWYTKMTVGTYINHPRKGKTQLFRRNVGKRLLRMIFNNPRVHTGRGYR